MGKNFKAAMQKNTEAHVSGAPAGAPNTLAPGAPLQGASAGAAVPVSVPCPSGTGTELTNNTGGTDVSENATGKLEEKDASELQKGPEMQEAKAQLSVSFDRHAMCLMCLLWESVFVH